MDQYVVECLFPAVIHPAHRIMVGLLNYRQTALQENNILADEDRSEHLQPRLLQQFFSIVCSVFIIIRLKSEPDHKSSCR